jgi:hypothetical protein
VGREKTKGAEENTEPEGQYYQEQQRHRIGQLRNP